MIKRLFAMLKKDGKFKDTALSLFSKIVAMIFFLLADIFIARILSKEQYGEWSFLVAIATILFSVGWMGINSSTCFSVANNLGSTKEKSYILSGVRIRIVSSIAFSILLLILAIPVSRVMGFPNKYPHLQSLFLLLPIWVMFNSFSDFFKHLNVGLIKFKNIFYITLSEFGGYLFFSLICLSLINSVIGVAIGHIAAVLAATLLGFLLLARYLKTLSLADSIRDKHTEMQILKYALPLFLGSVVSSLLMEMDTFMIGLIHMSEQTGIYAIAKNLTTKATNINLAICTGTMTAFAKLTAENIKTKRKLYIKINIINVCCIVAVDLAFILLGPFFIKLLYGNEYAASTEVLSILLIYYSLFSVSFFPATLLNYHHKAYNSFIFGIIMFICNLVFNLLLIPRYGASGAAIATCIAVVPYTTLLLIFAHKTLSNFDKEKEVCK